MDIDMSRSAIYNAAMAIATQTPTLFSFADDQASGADRLSDRATDRLRSMIITLQFEPGAVLDEGALARRLGYGRTPVREAVQRLTDERLVVVLPRRAAAVAPITVYDLRQIYEARVPLECLSARLSAQRATPVHIAQLEDGVGAIADAARSSAEETAQSDWAFHLALARASGNQYLGDSIRRILGPAMRLTYFTYSVGQPSQARYDEHLAILDAVKARDPDAADAAMGRHIAMARDRMVSRL
jgi:DNA-binding GntR family transcriptional regulator